MRRLIALLLTLALVIGLAPAALAKTHTLDIYWIANRDDETIRTGVEKAINAYLAELAKTKAIKEMEVAIHLITWDPAWTEQAIGALTEFSVGRAKSLFSQWKELGRYLMIKYMDGNIKQVDENGAFLDNGNGKNIPASPLHPKFRERWLRAVVADTN